jgi:hypothetical protein
MRKLVLITLIALIPTSSCYANLSLASDLRFSAADGGADDSAASQTLVAQPKPQTTQVQPNAAIKHPTAIKRPTISKPRRVLQRRQDLRTQGAYKPSHEHCF